MQKRIKLSIHTATYNRGYIIEQAYKSLQNQTCFDFEWVVTDDGSTDNTEDLFRKWCKDEFRFKIIYNKTQNGGIPRAQNFGLKVISGDYVFVLDSDDYLLPDTVEKLYKWIDEIDKIEDIVGVGGVIVSKNEKPLKGVYPKIDENIGYVDATNLQRRDYDLDADMREAYKVAIIKKYPYHVWNTEKFAPEQLCMDAMALDGYKVRWHKEPIYVCEYLEDGMTKGNWNLLRKNPMGFAMLSNFRLKYEKGFVNRFKIAAQHIALSIVGKNPSFILKSNDILLTILTLPYGLALSVRRKNQFKYDDPINKIRKI